MTNVPPEQPSSCEPRLTLNVPPLCGEVDVGDDPEWPAGCTRTVTLVASVHPATTVTARAATTAASVLTRRTY